MSVRPEERKRVDEPEDRGGAPVATAPTPSPGGFAPLFAGEEGNRFRGRWESIQVGFVDEPRRAVEEAEHLVGEMMKRLQETLAEERTVFERRWQRGEDVSTENLRQGLRRYRAFFDRLLTV